MPKSFDKVAEANERENHFELIFDSGKPKSLDQMPMGPSAYIAMGWDTTDETGRPMLTPPEFSAEVIKNQVEAIKAELDARVIEAFARFAASNAR